ncbi:C2 domain-containing protein At1g53590-like isoform X2 [Phragmites australis]|nr:C2 domain-containing protein At1g53590-like isoform X2 [Phragmites australis]XP_062178787.1 C2 domain-containing protein At1g53590-like isoform X2 [Phragmites australis]XP_062178852.1 C2 domain-containing protein At1g53590-like isoform X2 [Phragmites australis]XP_062178922.1 C2 domain-containing protein At1g53590-like isoform X2 [Phragmites australis]
MVNARCAMRLRKRIQHEEMKSAYQRRLLSDAESVRWLNHAIKKMWPICMEKIVSQLLRPIIPWFLDKFKPWTVSKASIQELYMGRNPPMFTSMRVLPETSDDDHLVLELGMNFLSAEDMSAVLAMQLHKSVGLGMTVNMHLSSMHVEGKILVGVKFVRSWPFLGRVRLCFVEPPYFQMTVKPLINHGLDVTEFPGISGWLDKLMDTAFGQTLVEPNMLVINVEKFASTPSENNWFSIEERPPIAYVKLEILEGTDMKSSDINGLADPYVKGRLGPFKFQTQIQRKTLSPKWFEEFKIPITSWEASNELVMEVRDKDPMFDDSLGACTIDVHELRGGQRHDKWISLKNVKKGRIRLSVTVEDISEDKNVSGLEESLRKADPELPLSTSIENNLDVDELPEEKEVLMDEVEHISIDGEEQPGGLYVHRPGTGVPKTWESRKGRARSPDTQIYQEIDKSKEIPTPKSSGQGGLFNLGSFFRKNSRKGSSKDLDPSLPTTPGSQSVTELDPKLPETPRPNLKELGEKRTSIKIVVNEEASPACKVGDAENSTEDVAKVIEKNVGEPGRSLTSTLSRKVSRKRPEDRLSDIPEQTEAHESELVSEGPIPVQGKPIEGHLTTEHGNGDGATTQA